MRTETKTPAARAAESGNSRRHGAKIWPRVVLYVCFAVAAIPFLFPTYWMIVSSLKPINEIFADPPSPWPLKPSLDGYTTAFAFQPFARQYFNSIYITVVVTFVTMLVSSLAGYAFVRIRFRGQNVLFLFCLLGLLVPSEVTIVPLFQMFEKVGMINTHWPLLLVTSIGAPSVLATFIMRQFFISLPVELEEAGRIDGLGRPGIWWRIAMPLARSALAAVAIFTFLNAWNLYLEPTVYLSSPDLFTLPESLTHYVDPYSGPMWNVQLAAATMTAVPMLIVFVIAQRQFVEGLAQAGLKG